MRPAEISARARKIRLTLAEIGARAGVDKTTVERTLNEKSDPRSSTLDAIRDAVIAAEKELLDYLAELHQAPPAPVIARRPELAEARA